MRRCAIALVLAALAAPAPAAAGWLKPQRLATRFSGPLALGAGGDGTRVAVWRARGKLRVTFAAKGGRFGRSSPVPGWHVKQGEEIDQPSMAAGPGGNAVFVVRHPNGSRLGTGPFDRGCCRQLEFALLRRDGPSHVFRLGRARTGDETLGGVAFGPRGQVAIGFRRGENAYVSLGTLAGRFAAPEIVAPQAGTVAGVFYRAGRVVVVYMRPVGAGANLVERTRSGRGRFGPARVIGKVADASRLVATTAADGSAAALWATPDTIFASGRRAQGVMHATTLEGRVSTQGNVGSVAAAPAGRAIAAWTDGSGLVAAAVRAPGQGFGPRLVVPATTVRTFGSPIEFIPSAAVAPSGWGVVAWKSAGAGHLDLVNGLEAVTVGPGGRLGTVKRLVTVSPDMGAVMWGVAADRYGGLVGWADSRGGLLVSRVTLPRR